MTMTYHSKNAECVRFYTKLGLGIRRARHAQGWSIKQLAEASGFDFNIVGQWERGDCRAPLHKIDKLAQVLNVPISQLLTANKAEDMDYRTDNERRFAKMTGMLIKEYREMKNMSQRDLAAKVGMGSQVGISNYETGKNTPSHYRLAQIADALSVTVEDLTPSANNILKAMGLDK
jgi:transcriptional regulator with XRE-family HTH domain